MTFEEEQAIALETKRLLTQAKGLESITARVEVIIDIIAYLKTLGKRERKEIVREIGGDAEDMRWRDKMS